MRINQFSIDFTNRKASIVFQEDGASSQSEAFGSVQASIEIAPHQTVEEARNKARHSAADSLERAAKALRQAM